MSVLSPEKGRAGAVVAPLTDVRLRMFPQAAASNAGPSLTAAAA